MKIREINNGTIFAAQISLAAIVDRDCREWTVGLAARDLLTVFSGVLRSYRLYFTRWADAEHGKYGGTALTGVATWRK